jgi:hypothetical protein
MGDVEDTEEVVMRAAATETVYEVEVFNAGDAEFRVVERPAARVFAVVRSAPEEPVELLAECPYSYNRETVRARALRIAGVLHDDDLVSNGI